jgi:hypothetical protein
MSTVRVRLYNLADSLYRFCRWDYFRIPKVIDFLRSVVIEDHELIKFFEKCENDTVDPRSNILFNYTKWPSLEKKTLDDDNIQIHEKLDKYEQDIPIILEYKSLF